jgi:hypothetical protein
LVRRLEDVRKVNRQTGQVTFRGFRASHVVASLQSGLCFEVEMPEREERGVIAEALGFVGRAGSLTAPKLLTAISEGENRFSDRPEEPYVLVTSISARCFGEIDVGEIGGCGLAFDRFLSEPFRSEHEKARMMSENQVLRGLPRPGNTMRSYAGVRVSVSGRSHEEAKERALDALDLLRGIWNLGINRYIGDRTSAGIRTSNNKLSLGPVHSLHHPDGRLADGPWLETDFVRPIISYRMDRDSEYVKEFEGWVREELGRIPYRRDLEAALRRYARALDRRDWDTSFVRLWGLLETLTGRPRYEELEKRALLMMPERDVPYHRQILRHLSRYRNRNVHAGHETATILTLIFQLKFYVERLLEFHLSAGPSFGSVGEAAQFLDPPSNRDALRVRTRPTERRQGSGRPGSM